MTNISIGYTLSSEEHTPQDLITIAQHAEQAGFEFLSISDHFHPWVDAQGESAFVWSILGALSQATEKIPIMTGVTAPIMRIHPVILAQATATTAALLNGRFLFGVGTGENLNEHVVGLGWPNINTRLQMLEEAIGLIRELWKGTLTDIQGSYFTIDQARIYSLPQQPPPIIISATGPKSAMLAGQIGDALVTTGPQTKVIEAFQKAGGQSKPIYGQVTVCYDQSEQKAKQIAARNWPNTMVSGQASQELPMPIHFEQLTSSLTPDQIAEKVPCGPDPQKHLEQIQSYLQAGFTHIYIHQIGPNQKECMDFYQSQIIPHIKA